MKDKRPNFIYILGDDHRAEYLGCAGHPIVETPNIDSMARGGFNFSGAYCTSPVCTPSRACHLLGQWERRHGVNFNSRSAVGHRAWETAFPCVLRENGYFTGWIGKNHVPVGVGGYEGGTFEKSFDYFYGNHSHSYFYVKERAHCGIYSNSDFDTQVEVFEQGAMNFLKPEKRFLDSCVSPLPERDASKPFCLCITFNLPHDCSTGEMRLRPEDDDLYKMRYRDRVMDFPLPATYGDAWTQQPPKLPREVYNGVQVPCYDYVHTPETMREKMVRTAQTVTGIDRMIGALRNCLEELGEADNTVIIFSTDHGLLFGEYGMGGKNLLYEPSVRIPMVLYDPTAPKTLCGKNIDSLVCPEDLASTVLDMAGLDIPASYQGRSLLPLLRDPSAAWREDLFLEANMDTQNYPRSDGIRTRQYKYIRYFKRSEDPAQKDLYYRGTLDDYRSCLNSTLYHGEHPVFEELYDLRADPHETVNLAGDPGFAATKTQLRDRLIMLGRELKAESELPDTVEYDNRI